MKLTGIIALSLCTFTSVLGQQPAATATPSPTLPPGPLLNRAPEMASWTITFRAVANPTGGGTKTEGRPIADPTDFRALIAKTGSIYHIQITMGSGMKVEKWCLNNAQVTAMPNAAYPVLSTTGSKDAYYMDFSKVDFPGFEWIGPQNFAGIKNVAGMDCLIFRDRLTEPAEMQAVIELKTRLPLYLQVGEALTAFQYSPPPAAILAPPANVLRLAEQWRQRMRQVTLVPPS
jgi:hypothetical protein